MGWGQSGLGYRTCSLSLIKALCFLAGSWFAPQTLGEEWHCRNPDVEVFCSDGRCGASLADNFTPLSVYFNGEGRLEVCAYTGCWEGDGEVRSVDRWLMIYASQRPFSTDPDNIERRADISILFDPLEKLAFVRADHFAQPLYCSP